MRELFLRPAARSGGRIRQQALHPSNRPMSHRIPALASEDSENASTLTSEDRVSPSGSQQLIRSNSEHLVQQRDRKFTNVDEDTWTYVNEVASITTEIMGYGNVPIPSYGCIAKISADSTISIRAVTWNINEKSVKVLTQLSDQIKLTARTGLEDIVSVALQELPSSSRNFHEDALLILSRAFEKDHSPYLCRRTRAQMMIVFIRKSLVRYATEPSTKFVAAKGFAKPVRTKGAIGICFRFCQKWIVLIGSHLSHENAIQRTLDYERIVKNMSFPTLYKFTHKNDMFAADVILFSGDLNFRLTKDEGLDWKSKAVRQTNVLRAMEVDELNLARSKGLVFEKFEEAAIDFAPSYKYENGTNNYTLLRTPSYTDRILYRFNDKATLKKIGDYKMLATTASDHKPVSGSFYLNVMGRPPTHRFYSTE